MRISAIRGQNLASLPSFSLDFDAHPLDATRIFAITGPTGAGKSTLLDALCLALFDRVPRLMEARGESGDLGLTAGDPRAVMRRGTTEAFAEVDFFGVDGARYRARWEAWRARRRADGRIQDQRLKLERVSRGQGDPTVVLSEARKTDTLHAISDRLGLRFPEFRRAVLLAQGDFAAFLTARPDERAALLERITGTELYAALSQKAYLRAREEAEQEDLLTRRLGVIEVLKDEARTALENEIAELRETVEQATLRLVHAEAALTWYRTEQTLAGECERAAEEHDERKAAAQEIPELEARLHRLEAVARLRPLVSALEEAAARRALARAALAEAEADKQVATEHRARCDADRARTEAEHNLWSERAGPLRQEIVRARALDQELVAATQHLRILNQALDLAEDGPQLPPDHELALMVVRRHQLYQDGEALKPRQQAASVDHRLAQKRLEEAHSARADAEAGYAAARRGVAAAQEALHLALAQGSRPRLAEAQEQLDRFAHAVRSLRRATSEHAKRTTELARIQRSLLREVKAAEAGEAKERALRMEASRQGVHLAQQRKALSAALAQEDWETQRGRLLQEDQPCPLCGSTDHPWRAATPPTSGKAALRNLEAAIALAEKAHHGALTEATAAAERTVAAGSRARDLRGRKKALEDEATEANRVLVDLRDRLSSIWVESGLLHQVGLARVGVLLPESLPTDRRALAPALEGLERVEEALVRLGTEADAAEDAVRTAESRAVRAQAALDTARTELKAAEQRGADLEARRSELDEAMRRVRAEQQTHHEHLTERRNTAETHRLALTRERGRLLEGRSADESERALDDALARASEGRQRAEEGLRAAELALGSAQANAAARREACTEAEVAVDAGSERRNAFLADFPEEERNRLLARAGQPPEDPELLVHRRDGLRLSLARAESTLRDRQERLAKHREQAPATSLTEAESANEELLGQLEAARSHLARSAALLEADGAAHAKRRALRPELDAQRKRASLWAELSEVIGSSDGKKLRTFAQGLTLDVLIHQSNLHLRTLRPRYRLRRVKSTDMELEVVDMDMGEEVRSVSSLSGGETFLSSLALALGLSDLSARTVMVESLFVDEGFGALDPESLELALGALDQLQADGRTIGVVSHLPEVAERIGFEVRVRPSGPGRSEVTVVAP